MQYSFRHSAQIRGADGTEQGRARRCGAVRCHEIIMTAGWQLPRGTHTALAALLAWLFCVWPGVKSLAVSALGLLMLRAGHRLRSSPCGSAREVDAVFDLFTVGVSPDPLPLRMGWTSPSHGSSRLAPACGMVLVCNRLHRCTASVVRAEMGCCTSTAQVYSTALCHLLSRTGAESTDQRPPLCSPTEGNNTSPAFVVGR